MVLNPPSFRSSSGRGSTQSLKDFHVLLVDDEVELSRMIRESLLMLDATCTMFNSSTEALECLRQQEFDVVLSDIYMPNHGGHEILAASIELWPETPVILMTGNPTLDNTLEALREGAYDYIIKPFTIDQLHFAIQRAVSYRRLARENKRYHCFLEQEVQERTKELSEFLFHSVQSLMRALEARDPYTQGHGDRVASIVISLACELGVPEREYETLRLACQLHDIGKIGVTDTILLKPGKLTEEEYAIMKTHVEIGYNILAPIPHLREVSRYVYEHHERMDGKGYPRGLSGNEIHMNSRIICVAEVLDALASKRCYKPAWPVDKIVDYFDECSGTAYDPVIVDALKTLLRREGKTLLSCYSEE